MTGREEQFYCIQNAQAKLGAYGCPEVWDGILCWPEQPPSSIAIHPCPLPDTRFIAEGFASKTCDSAGIWLRSSTFNKTWTNYTMCSVFENNEYQDSWLLLYIALAGYGVSTISLILALIVFCKFRSLHCQRVTLHKHLFISYIINAVVGAFWLISAASTHNTQVYCKLLNVLNQFTQLSNYFWMLCEGIYLHGIVITSVFRTKQKMFVFILLGWGFPLIPSGLYMLASFLYDNTNCWIEHDTAVLFVVHGPIYAALLMNFGILLNLLRVLSAKLQTPHQNISRSYAPAVRAALVLMLLLGTHHIILTFITLTNKTKSVQEVVMYIEVILNVFQGFVVSIIFCFSHNEVIQKFSFFLTRICRQRPDVGDLSETSAIALRSCYNTSFQDIQPVTQLEVTIDKKGREKNTLLMTPHTCMSERV
ncbi:calcitonin receptor-like [Clavelina lepadiformis]|uniref:Calcitonin gene-related peptide type 1 receptor n=1 Tax=Clavelina lepadiformis TaxID=159417 RepID=A0ABP0G3H7_CLALP